MWHSHYLLSGLVASVTFLLLDHTLFFVISFSRPSSITSQNVTHATVFPLLCCMQYLFQCCYPREKFLSSRTNSQVLVLGPQVLVLGSQVLVLDHKVLENCRGLQILETVYYVSLEVRKFSYHHCAWGYGEEWLTYWYHILLTDIYIYISVSYSSLYFVYLHLLFLAHPH